MTTSFRLAFVSTVTYLAVIGLLLGFLYFGIARQLNEVDAKALRAELDSLAAAYDSGSRARLNQAIIEQSTAYNRFYYLLTYPDGSPQSGDFAILPSTPPEKGFKDVEFDFEIAFGDVIERRAAKGIIARLPDKSALMVAIDMSQTQNIIATITNAVWMAALGGLAIALIGAYFVHRSAARHAATLVQTTQAVMAGDLSRRAPIWGSGDEFDTLALQINNMLDRLDKAMTSMRHVGDSLAHDLRSPLNRLRNQLETGLREDLPKEEALGAAIEETDRVLATFSAILRLSRLEAGQTARFDAHDLGELIEEVMEFYEPVFEEEGREVQIHSKLKSKVTCDRDLILQAINNLVSNARKYGGEAARIEISTRLEAKQDYVIEVSDSGPGVKEEDRKRLSERFFRLEAARTEHGNGLGLALVSAIAEMHGGVLSFHDGLKQKDGDGFGLKVRMLMKRRPQ